jgi:hypothetical protein
VQARPAADLLQARLCRAVAELDRTSAARFALPGPPPVRLVDRGNVSASRGTVRLGAPKVTGAVPSDVVQRLVRQHIGGLLLCYRQALERKPALDGSVEALFEIQPDGRAGGIAIGGTLPDTSVKACVAGVFSSVSFPASGGGTRVTYPLVMSPPAPGPVAGAVEAPVEGIGLGAIDSPRSEEASLPLPPPDGPWPIVVLDETDVRFDGSALGAVAPLTRPSGPTRVDALFARLRAWRAEWTQRHPGLRFPGVAGLRIEGAPPALALKSVFQTIAFAGFPLLFVQEGDAPDAILELAAQLPGEPTRNAAAGPATGVFMQARLERSRAVLDLKRGHVTLASVDVPIAELDRRVCAFWGERPRGAGDGEGRAHALRVHFADDVPYARVARFVRTAGACPPAFWTTLSIR